MPHRIVMKFAEQLLKQKVRALGNRCNRFRATSRLGVKIAGCLFACVNDDYAKRRTETTGVDGGKWWPPDRSHSRIVRTFALNSWPGIGAPKCGLLFIN